MASFYKIMSDFTLAGQIVDLFNNAYLSGVWHYQICLRISLDLRKVHSWQYWQWMFECSFFSATISALQIISKNIPAKLKPATSERKVLMDIFARLCQCRGGTRSEEHTSELQS